MKTFVLSVVVPSLRGLAVGLRWLAGKADQGVQALAIWASATDSSDQAGA